jgi:sulfane dehydrogenase subunit SoxC
MSNPRHRQDQARNRAESVPKVAGNGLLDRRALLSQGVALAGAMSVGAAGAATGAAAEPLVNDPWSLAPGVPIPPYGQPSRFEEKTVRTLSNPKLDPRGSAARTPHHLLNGAITPNGLHFVIARGGYPDIDPDKHKLVIHGRVRQPLTFTVEALLRYPMVSRVTFMECGGNSAPLWSKEPVQGSVQAIHGLVSCAEWTGVRLSTLFEEVGIDPEAKWFLAEGADAPTMHRSIPVMKAMDDAMIALYQNGERINPSNGYPMRLLLPGYEGNMNVKWLRRIKVVDAPIMAQNETMAYTILLPSGKAWQFFYPQEVKSFISQPSPGMVLKGSGFYEISGLAWSGNGRISKVEVSADGGKSWALAALQTPVLSKALTRFRMPWNWDGSPSVLLSRATDEAGNVQPSRAEFLAERGQPRGNAAVTAFPMEHCNMISSWGVSAKGEVTNVYV